MWLDLRVHMRLPTIQSLVTIKPQQQSWFSHPGSLLTVIVVLSIIQMRLLGSSLCVVRTRLLEVLGVSVTRLCFIR